MGAIEKRAKGILTNKSELVYVCVCMCVCVCVCVYVRCMLLKHYFPPVARLFVPLDRAGKQALNSESAGSQTS